MQRFRASNYIDVINQPRPEERALARVSKDGHKRGRQWPSFETRANRRAPLDEVVGSGFRPSELIGFIEPVHLAFWF